MPTKINHARFILVGIIFDINGDKCTYIFILSLLHVLITNNVGVKRIDWQIIFATHSIVVISITFNPQFIISSYFMSLNFVAVESFSG